jgi:polysaccharide deacetylase 2 family uncharacterized protein YibQ
MREKTFQVIIGLMTAIIILQWLFIASLEKPKKEGVTRRKPQVAKPARVAPVPVVKGKIAIVIDDWGYNQNNLGTASLLKYPWTASVLPGLSYSRKVCEELHRHGVQIILHLPMEPKEKSRLEENTILTSFDEAAIYKIIADDLESLAYVKGVSNHMGSKVTEDPKIMGIIMRQLKKKGLYFLDSFVTSQSVGADVAGKLGLGFARRDIFLDNTEDAQYIRSQLLKLKAKARMYGQAIGVGHDRKVTMQVLREVMPQFEKEGYKFVVLSELIR